MNILSTATVVQQVPTSHDLGWYRNHSKTASAPPTSRTTRNCPKERHGGKHAMWV